MPKLATLLSVNAESVPRKLRRTEREFISHFGRAPSYYSVWENVKRDDVLQGSTASFKSDTSQLAAIICDNLSPLSAAPVISKRTQPEAHPQAD